MLLWLINFRDCSLCFSKSCRTWFWAHVPETCHCVTFSFMTAWNNSVTWVCRLAFRWKYHNLWFSTLLNYHRIIVLFRWIIAPSACFLVEFIPKNPQTSSDVLRTTTELEHFDVNEERDLYFFSEITWFSVFFVSFPQKRNGIVFSSGVNYLHSDLSYPIRVKCPIVHVNTVEIRSPQQNVAFRTFQLLLYSNTGNYDWNSRFSSWKYTTKLHTGLLFG